MGEGKRTCPNNHAVSGPSVGNGYFRTRVARRMPGLAISFLKSRVISSDFYADAQRVRTESNTSGGSGVLESAARQHGGFTDAIRAARARQGNVNLTATHHLFSQRHHRRALAPPDLRSEMLRGRTVAVLILIAV